MSKISSNVRFVHEEAIKPDPEYAQKPIDWFVGRAVKTLFESKSRSKLSEHMWVRITHVDCGTLVGTLASDPMCLRDLKYGDIVTLTPAQIEMVELNVGEFMEETERLITKDDYFNKHLGQPVAVVVCRLFHMSGFSPRLALRRWRRFAPGEWNWLTG